MAAAFIEEQERHQDQDAAGGDGLETRIRLLGVIVDLDRQRGVAVERASGHRRIEPAAPTISSGAVSPIARESPRIVPVRMPGRPTGRTWSRTICQRVAPRARAAWRSECGTVRSASWVAITMIGRISRLKRQDARQERRPQREGLDPEGPHEEGQARGCRRRSTARRRGWRCSSG